MMKVTVATLAATLTKPPAASREAALSRLERTSAVTHLMASLEHLANGRERRFGGVNNWSVTRGSSPITGTRARWLMDAIALPRVTNGLHLARIAAAATLLAPGASRGARITADAVLAGSSLALHPRHHYGTDGSDQVSFLTQSAALLARAAGRRTRVVDHALWTVALQATLSYAISGWAKLAGPTWREGRALAGVTRTLTYGDRQVWQLTQRYPRLARVLGTSVLALECTFPLAYLAGGRLANAYVAATTSFHVGVGKVMALGRFIPAFLSMHGPVQYTARSQVATTADGIGRDDTMPRLVLLAAAGTMAAALRVRNGNRCLVLAGRGDERVFRTADGNELRYRLLGSTDPQTPVYVLENALLASPEHWEWIAAELAKSATVLTYSRAGYGPSTCRRGTALVLDDLVTHLGELVEHVCADRRVVLVGHSLGGYLALKTAARMSPPPAAVVLLDASHPDEMRRSKRQELGSKAMTEGIALTMHTLELGGGLLLDRPEWVDALPEPARATIFAQYRDARLWRAARREWSAVLREFDSQPDLAQVPVPVLSLSAGRTVAEDPVQGDMHRELAELGTSGRHEVVADADHDSLLTRQHHAENVAQRIRQFAEDPTLADEESAA